jgi:hypothetical protein
MIGQLNAFFHNVKCSTYCVVRRRYCLPSTHYAIRTILILFLSLITFTTIAQAQTDPPPPLLVISNSDVRSPPTVALDLYGISSTGEKLLFAPNDLLLRHNGTAVDDFSLSGTRAVGTFTLFLIDIPSGVTGQMAAIEAALIQYASDPTMQEQLDAIAVYKVGESDPIPLLEPTRFHNSVRNLFADPPQPIDAPTALIDSSVNLLNDIESLKPSPAMTAFVVIFSDGTDSVSSQYQMGDIRARGAELGIPVHTVWLQNEALSAGAQEFGRTYLSEVAAGTRGLTSSLNNQAGLSAIFDRIAGFRNQTRLVYTVPDAAGGGFNVEVSLASEPGVTAATSADLPANLPQVSLDIPPDSRTLSLPELVDPVRLGLGATVGWLDGETRNIVAAQLLANGTVIQDVPPGSLNRFEAQISNFSYGDNTLQLAVLDNQGLRATSPPLTLTVNEGPLDIPDALSPQRGWGGVVTSLLLGLFCLLFGLGLAAFAWQRGWLVLHRRQRPQPGVTSGAESAPITDGHSVAHVGGPVGGQRDIYSASAYLEVLEATSSTPAQIPLHHHEEKIGRSPAQSNIAFPEDVTVSRLHATLMREGAYYRIYDAQSTSGTWVNDQQVPEYGMQLMDGDEIHMGAVHLRFRTNN